MKVLTQDEYETVIRSGLRDQGLNDQVADFLIGARWPMYGHQALAECAGRGLLLSEQDLADWVHETVGYFWEDDGEVVEPMVTWLGHNSIDGLLEWALAHGRGKSSLSGILATQRPEVVKMICRPMKGQMN